ncbi:MAG TPA: PIN domain-containing protein [Acidimicrobiales bacterium]|nr:PIN domain-containing protein [Acidimicrobiales bacterium]
MLDTTFLIDADRSGDALDGVIADVDDVAVAAVTIAELRVGGLLGTRKKGAARTAFVEDVLAAIPVIAYDLAVAEAHARLLVEVRRQGTPRGAHDLLIAATAVASRRTVVTADAAAFASLPDLEVRHHR